MNLTTVDWYAFRFRGAFEPIAPALKEVFSGVNASVDIKPRKSGWQGYEASADIVLDDAHIGLLAFGGKNQKEWVSVSFSGQGCNWLGDVEAAESVFSELPHYETRRVDIALDTFKRESSHEQVMAAYEKGLFNLGGRPPKISQVLPGEAIDGRTVYIGNRERDKFLRAYEKGYELIKDFHPSLKSQITTIDGAPVGDIYRLELELKAKSGPLPVDLLERRDQYFAGAYPYLQTVLEVEPEIFVRKRERSARLDLASALSQIQTQYGATLFTALAAYHGDVGAVWERIIGRNHSERLLAAGVLLVDHSEVEYA